MYANKKSLANLFGISYPTVYRRVEGIEEEMGKGKRYNRYAICDGLVSVAVFADYEKYHRRLTDKNLRKTVPPFDMDEASAYIIEKAREGKI